MSRVSNIIKTVSRRQSDNTKYAKDLQPDRARLDKYLEREEEEKCCPAGNMLAGKIVCVTGKFSGHTRKEMHALLEECGATVRGGVSGKIDLLVAGDNAGSKISKAKGLGIEVWDEEDTMDAINNESGSSGDDTPPPITDA